MPSAKALVGRYQLRSTVAFTGEPPTGVISSPDAALRQLARKIELTGGHVRQLTLRAAFLAAAEETKIGLAHIAHAARAEYAKLGLPPIEIDVSEKRRAA